MERKELSLFTRLPLSPFQVHLNLTGVKRGPTFYIKLQKIGIYNFLICTNYSFASPPLRFCCTNMNPGSDTYISGQGYLYKFTLSFLINSIRNRVKSLPYANMNYLSENWFFEHFELKRFYLLSSKALCSVLKWNGDETYKIRPIRLDISLQKHKILYLNSQLTDSQSGVITVTPKSQLGVGDTEKLLVTFSHAWLILVDIPKFTN